MLKEFERSGILQPKDRTFLRLHLQRSGHDILELRQHFKEELDGIAGFSDDTILHLPANSLGPLPVDFYHIPADSDVSIQMFEMMRQIF
jgi:hypothetical protein